MQCHYCAGTGHEINFRRMKEFREALGISQTDLAKQMKISKSYLSDLEHGRRAWNAVLLKKIPAGSLAKLNPKLLR